MSTLTHIDVDPHGRLARSQQARRDRIFGAVIELAAAGGPDAVQVREVASRADVATATIYNYFQTRENLLRAALFDWRRKVAAESVGSTGGSTIEERVLSLLRNTFDSFVQHPKLFDTFMRLQLQPGEHDSVVHHAMVHAMENVLSNSDKASAENFQMILERVIYATLMFAAQGVLPLAQIWPDIETTVRVLALHVDDRRNER
jgi:AcrR family transcriptional regulator